MFSQVAFQDFLSVNCLGLGRFFCPLVGVGLGPHFFISIGGPDDDLPRNFSPMMVQGCEAGRIPACAGGAWGKLMRVYLWMGLRKKMPLNLVPALHMHPYLVVCAGRLPIQKVVK